MLRSMASITSVVSWFTSAGLVSDSAQLCYVQGAAVMEGLL